MGHAHAGIVELCILTLRHREGRCHQPATAVNAALHTSQLRDAAQIHMFYPFDRQVAPDARASVFGSRDFGAPPTSACQHERHF